MKHVLVIVLEESPKEPAQTVPLVDGLVLGVKDFGGVERKFFDKLRQVFKFPLLFEELILRVAFLGDALKEMLDAGLLLESFLDDVEVLAGEVLASFSQFEMEVEQVRFQLIHLTLFGYFQRAPVEPNPFLDRLCEFSYDNF